MLEFEEWVRFSPIVDPKDRRELYLYDLSVKYEKSYARYEYRSQIHKEDLRPNVFGNRLVEVLSEFTFDDKDYEDRWPEFLSLLILIINRIPEDGTLRRLCKYAILQITSDVHQSEIHDFPSFVIDCSRECEKRVARTALNKYLQEIFDPNDEDTPCKDYLRSDPRSGDEFYNLFDALQDSIDYKSFIPPEELPRNKSHLVDIDDLFDEFVKVQYGIVQTEDGWRREDFDTEPYLQELETTFRERVPDGSWRMFISAWQGFFEHSRDLLNIYFNDKGEVDYRVDCATKFLRKMWNAALDEEDNPKYSRLMKEIK